MTPTKVFEIVDVNKELPECHSQHNTAFASNELFVICKDKSLGYGAFFRNGEHTSKGWEEISQQWTEPNVTHWLKETNEKYLLSEEELDSCTKEARELIEELKNELWEKNQSNYSDETAELITKAENFLNNNK